MHAPMVWGLHASIKDSMRREPLDVSEVLQA